MLTSCGGAGGSTSKGGFLKGVLLAPDGQTPIPGATVYVPGSPLTGGFSATSPDCEEPLESYAVYTCTGPDGSFTLDISRLSGVITVKFKKGSFEKTVTVDLASSSGSLGSISLPSDPDQGAPEIAVVTGYYDQMEIVLAKLGFGELDPFTGYIKLGTEKFDLYDGNYSLDDTVYKDFPAIFDDNDGDGKPDIYNYDIVFINCGNDYEYSVLTDSSKISILRDYVLNGGKLYITDLSYDFVEQVFPEFIDFYGSELTPESDPENMNEAEVGEDGITTEAEVLDSTLKEWLKEVSCKDSYGNTVDCINPVTERVHIEGFMSGWAVINGAHPGKTGDVKIWIRGEVSSWNFGNEVKPLTVSFKFGAGKVLYTSYHTESYSPPDGFLPQERILQYLVFF